MNYYAMLSLCYRSRNLNWTKTSPQILWGEQFKWNNLSSIDLYVLSWIRQLESLTLQDTLEESVLPVNKWIQCRPSPSCVLCCPLLLHPHWSPARWEDLFAMGVNNPSPDSCTPPPLHVLTVFWDWGIDATDLWNLISARGENWPRHMETGIYSQMFPAGALWRPLRAGYWLSSPRKPYSHNIKQHVSEYINPIYSLSVF